jgi:cold shock CspA family protein
MVTGRILQFDHARGYGFVGADDDGEDVFLHASVFDGDTDELAPGTKVEFKVMAGDRGRKAFAAYRIDEPKQDLVPSPRPAPSRPAPLSHPTPGPRPGVTAPQVPPPAPTPPPPPPQLQTRPAPQVEAQVPAKDQGSDDEQMCDVLSPAEFGQEMTELLLNSVPTLTGQQVLEVRQTVLEAARKHGWMDI